MADEQTKQVLKTIKEMKQDLVNDTSAQAELRKRTQSQVQEIEQILESDATKPIVAQKAKMQEIQAKPNAAKNAQSSSHSQNQASQSRGIPAKPVQTSIPASSINEATTKQIPIAPTRQSPVNPMQNAQAQRANNIQNTALNTTAKPPISNPADVAQNIHLQSLQDIANTTAKQNLESNPNSNINDLKQDKYNQIVKANVVGKQETWLLLEEFLNLSGLERDKVEELIKDRSIKSKEENGRIYIEASTGTSALIKKVENRLVSLDISGNALDPVFVEKTIATILGLHDKVISSKDETISAFKSENSFLKEALVSMQEIYDDDKKTIELLRQQLQKTQEEVEFVKRKYKLMWGRVSNSTT
ncbi:Uncharacterised protein [Helicobacter muridarum]|uniref:DUF3972 domain-containing protein n=1 Tax=Helicobacter muridarum TaxID=216 RepID=A0A377PRJ1_9HELI|nr:Uncharacterised protein [Helicobacter muridarum]